MHVHAQLNNWRHLQNAIAAVKSISYDMNWYNSYMKKRKYYIQVKQNYALINSAFINIFSGKIFI